MKILLLNGSPRANGNTKTALNQLVRGLQSNVGDAEVEMIDITKRKISGCIACESCQRNGGECVIPDDSAYIIRKIYDADVVVIGTPVYYWGMTSQMKMVVDKFYSRNDQFNQQKKSLGIIVIGEAGLDDPQYQLISKQFECISNYLGWDFIFSKSISAYEADDLANDHEKLRELYELSAEVKTL